MTTRQWLPSEWMDEIVPGLADDPSDFIEQDADGSWHLRPKNESDRDNDFFHEVLEPGRVVKWRFFEDYGEVRVTVGEAPDEFTVHDPVPDTTTHFVANHDIETLADSMEGLVDGYGWGEPLNKGEHQIQIYRWSDSLPFRFEIDQDGKGRFVCCAGAN
ncbi:hypothetical protein [Jiella marina]|uniref:hypothetical protein n=1 Tax=Jiella sp. LLJ827 TaxID=2917712 RepID=UPI002100EE9A|nr:hypothetical protein [Jiella sp. LLJ827]MCQ0986437.1 hypothetical protein [Jiella sp. LLJ827]